RSQTKDRWWNQAAGSLFLLCGSWCSLHADEAPDKGRYHLFNPTPRAFLREMITDRPDKTESPYTVDAGHFQFEADVLNYSYDRYNAARADTRVESVAIAPINFKLGLCNRADLQLVVQSYNAVRTHDRAAGTVDKQRGFGDVVPRLKVNLWGNDGGATAFGVMSFVKLPTNQDRVGNNSVEGGVIFPLAVALPKGWGMGLMTEVDFIRDGVGRGRHPEFINSITFGHDIVDNLGGYLEFFSAVSRESGSCWIGTADVGLTYGLTKDLQLDAGVNFGLTRSADDINPFFGISWRF
ncbi:MAG TPA: transporter, partial [Verrucomicrobiae bacterium]